MTTVGSSQLHFNSIMNQSSVFIFHSKSVNKNLWTYMKNFVIENVHSAGLFWYTHSPDILLMPQKNIGSTLISVGLTHCLFDSFQFCNFQSIGRKIKVIQYRIGKKTEEKILAMSQIKQSCIVILTLFQTLHIYLLDWQAVISSSYICSNYFLYT